MGAAGMAGGSLDVRRVDRTAWLQALRGLAGAAQVQGEHGRGGARARPGHGREGKPGFLTTMQAPSTQTNVSFQSGPNKLSAILHTPDVGTERPAFVVLHGFGAHKDAPNTSLTAEFLASRGYVALRPDMRGCGESEGERGFIRCLDQ